ncbi:MAG: polynucleotide kinase-phosphatase [Myxococcota bacterium]
MIIEVPALSLVCLVGASGSGKSTLARRLFKPTEVLSSDAFRAMLADDENDQTATPGAFELLHLAARRRLAAGRLTVVDATNLRAEDRAQLVAIARDHDVFAIAIALALPIEVCLARNDARGDRRLPAHAIRDQARRAFRSLRELQREGFRRTFVLDSVDAVDAVELQRARLWSDHGDDAGPFDIIGDVHGCCDELERLLTALGYHVGGTRLTPVVTPPAGRRALFLGDLVDRGPDSPGVLRLVMSMVAAGHARCVPGNHEAKLLKHLRGAAIKLSHGLALTVGQLAAEPEPERFAAEVASFIDGLVSHLVLDGGRLVVAHAGMRQAFQGRSSGRVRAFALYGETTGETDELGLPVRHDWAAEYRGPAHVVYGHTPAPEATWVNRTLCIDTGCVFGGKLTALRWPEKELVSVAARRVYYEPVRPLLPPPTRSGHALDFEDVGGKQILRTRYLPSVTINAEQAAAALESMSRFTLDPRWLVYLPPTMAAPETHRPRPDDARPWLEHPHEVFRQFADDGVSEVVCQEKHMGSRAVVIVGRDADAIERRFGMAARGVVYTRSGRRFFDDAALEERLLERLAAAATRAGLWDELASDWMLLDAELMPWSAKAQELLRQQYAPTGAAGRAALSAASEVLARAGARGVEVGALAEAVAARAGAVEGFVRAYRQYCWSVTGLDDLRLAPFHLLATEGKARIEHDHLWHMATLARLAAEDPLFVATEHRLVALDRPDEVEAATAWWEALVGRGGEGMVVKPRSFVARGRRGLVQPAVKCRGPEYLRIIYGPEYDLPHNLERLRARHVGAKRALALRELSLGLEAVHRLADGDMLHAIHRLVFGVLALESEPVDPRL